MDNIKRNKLISGHLNDHIIFNKINDFLIKNGMNYCYWDYCGAGAEGEAYKIHDFHNVYGIIKITTRKMEYLISNHLKNKNFKHIYKTINNSILIPNELYLIYKPYYIIDSFLIDNKELDLEGLKKIEGISQQLVEMTNEFQYFGSIEDFDVHGGNLGWDGENLVHFDVDEYPYGLFMENYFL